MSATCIDTVYNRSHGQGYVHWWPRMWNGWKCHNLYAGEGRSLKVNILNSILHVALIFWTTDGAADTEKQFVHTFCNFRPLYSKNSFSKLIFHKSF